MLLELRVPCQDCCSNLCDMTSSIIDWRTTFHLYQSIYMCGERYTCIKVYTGVGNGTLVSKYIQAWENGALVYTVYTGVGTHCTCIKVYTGVGLWCTCIKVYTGVGKYCTCIKGIYRCRETLHLYQSIYRCGATVHLYQSIYRCGECALV